MILIIETHNEEGGESMRKGLSLLRNILGTIFVVLVIVAIVSDFINPSQQEVCREVVLRGNNSYTERILQADRDLEYEVHAYESELAYDCK